MAASVASAAASIVIGAMFTVVLNQLWAMRREHDDRVWVLRGQHLQRLHPILQTDAGRLTDLGGMLVKYGRLSPTGPDLKGSVQEGDKTLNLLYGDVLSHDLKSHYSEYDQQKEKVIERVSAHDRQFLDMAEAIRQELRIPGEAEKHRLEIALGVIERCMHLGPGITMTLTSGSFNYTSPISSNGGNSPPPPDIVAARDGFNAYHPSARVNSACEELRSQADGLGKQLTDLSAEARRLAEQTILLGDCPYVRIEP